MEETPAGARVIGSGCRDSKTAATITAAAAIAPAVQDAHAGHRWRAGAAKASFGPSRHLGLRLWAGYWHFVGAIWVLLYVTVFVL